MKIRLGISACLLGQKTRYDGSHQFDALLADTFGGFVEWVAVCPEVEYGLPVPREKMRLEGDPHDASSPQGTLLKFPDSVSLLFRAYPLPISCIK